MKKDNCAEHAIATVAEPRGEANRQPLARRAEWLPVALEVSLTLLVGAAGALLAQRIDLPGGAFTGAMLATAIARLLEGPLREPPAWLRSLARIVLGLSIGATVTTGTLISIGRALLPVAVIIISMIGLGLLVAWAINRITHMSLVTALCGSTPGVLAAMVALADDLEADGRVVASMHLVRLMSILVIVPALVRIFLPAATLPMPPSSVASAAGDLPRLACLLGLGVAGGILALRLKLPAGELLAALAVAAVANPAWLHLAQVPGSWRVFSQWVIGAGVGATVTRAALHDFRPFAVAGGLMTACLIMSGLALGCLLAQMTSLDLVTCVVGSSPGGADQMIILAGELGADAQLVAAMHISRQIILLLLLPAVTRIVCGRRATNQRLG